MENVKHKIAKIKNLGFEEESDEVPPPTKVSKKKMMPRSSTKTLELKSIKIKTKKK